MVLHYAARLQDRGGKPRRQGVDPMVRRWVTPRNIPLIPHQPRWDAENGRYDIHGRDDGWIAMKPDLILDFGGGNAHRRFLALAKENEPLAKFLSPGSGEPGSVGCFRSPLHLEVGIHGFAMSHQR